MARPSTMNLSEAVAIASSSLWAHKLRSVLTLIGVVIGVAAVIAVVSLINGANQYVATKVFNLGADVFGIAFQPSIVRNVDDWLEFQKRKRLHWDDYLAVKQLCKTCKEVGASLGGRVEVRSGVNSIKDTNLRAWTPEMPELYDVDLVEGRHISDADLTAAAPVCTVGMDIVENLLPTVDPVGKEVRWNSFSCQVIGVGKKQGTSLGTSLDNWIITSSYYLSERFWSAKLFAAHHRSRRLCGKNPGKRRRSPPNHAGPSSHRLRSERRFRSRNQRIVSLSVERHQLRLFRRYGRHRLDLACC